MGESPLTDLYLKKGWCLRRISSELGCAKTTVRKKLLEAGVEVKEQVHDDSNALNKKIETMRERGMSYQTIANIFNLWKIATPTGNGQWHSKTVREVERKSWKSK